MKPDPEFLQQCLARVETTAWAGNKQAAAWLKGQGKVVVSTTFAGYTRRGRNDVARRMREAGHGGQRG